MNDLVAQPSFARLGRVRDPPRNPNAAPFVACPNPCAKPPILTFGDELGGHRV